MSIRTSGVLFVLVSSFAFSPLAFADESVADAGAAEAVVSETDAGTDVSDAPDAGVVAETQEVRVEEKKEEPKVEEKVFLKSEKSDAGVIHILPPTGEDAGAEFTYQDSFHDPFHDKMLERKLKRSSSYRLRLWLELLNNGHPQSKPRSEEDIIRLKNLVLLDELLNEADATDVDKRLVYSRLLELLNGNPLKKGSYSKLQGRRLTPVEEAFLDEFIRTYKQERLDAQFGNQTILGFKAEPRNSTPKSAKPRSLDTKQVEPSKAATGGFTASVRPCTEKDMHPTDTTYACHHEGKVLIHSGPGNSWRVYR